jgi:hypothetical protein
LRAIIADSIRIAGGWVLRCIDDPAVLCAAILHDTIELSFRTKPDGKVFSRTLSTVWTRIFLL